VGPGDPELMTLKAIRHMQSANVIAIPDTKGQEQTAFLIASQAVDLSKKENYLAFVPMTKDKEVLEQSHEKVALDICGLLEQGKNIAFLTLGDPSIYSTYSYIHERVLAKGYKAEIIPGVTSFSAVAAKLNHGLCEGGEPLHILPASYKGTEDYLHWKGTKVLMKSGKEFGYLRERLKENGLLDRAKMVSRCGMTNEKVFESIEEADEKASYFSIIVVKEKNT